MLRQSAHGNENVALFGDLGIAFLVPFHSISNGFCWYGISRLHCKKRGGDLKGFRKIWLPNADEFLACSVATNVLVSDVRNIAEISSRVIDKGYGWCIANKDPKKDAKWWEEVRQIEENFCWDRFTGNDADHYITAKVEKGSLEFGHAWEGFGGGCHRAIALAVAINRKNNPIPYQPFDIMLNCS